MAGPDPSFLPRFSPEELKIVNDAVSLSEELVCEFYKMSAAQWGRFRYDIRTLDCLTPDEIVFGPFAQVIRYEAKRRGSSLGSALYDFYAICLQDHAILPLIAGLDGISLFPFMLYVTVHELIHIVRFSRFLQYFDAGPEERVEEEKRVHRRTHEILSPRPVPGLAPVLRHFQHTDNLLETWR
ncbi:MAG: hypothetical protein CSB33_03985 [Desulfobacterales bacterium]|nr:MAG: hypothetical protein CSB33_03985 [Desulfobacterales bacterium]